VSAALLAFSRLAILLPRAKQSEANMKTILSVLLVLGLCSLARAADEKTNPVGTWKLEYAIGDQQRTATLTITKDADKLAGTIDWPDQKDAKVKDVKLKDGELTFSAVRELGDNKIPIDYKFTIDGDKLKGKGAVENQGQKTEFDITGKREKKDK
jgi:hypothetical protein